MGSAPPCSPVTQAELDPQTAQHAARDPSAIKCRAQRGTGRGVPEGGPSARQAWRRWNAASTAPMGTGHGTADRTVRPLAGREAHPQPSLHRPPPMPPGSDPGAETSVERRLKATRRTPVRRARVITAAMFSTMCVSNPAMPGRHARRRRSATPSSASSNRARLRQRLSGCLISSS
jgi:hypothetical protein